jgi:hypothetical protein
MAVPAPDHLIFVKMKARRADEHFQSLEKAVGKWSVKPYTITEKTDLDHALHIVEIDITPTPEIIPMLFGDFICCLRSALDQLAWRLAHLDPSRTFTKNEERSISFPIFTNPWTYNDRRGLYPPAVARILDSLQPDLREDVFRDDLLWQLDKLWNLDKHRTIPTLPYMLNLGFGVENWQSISRYRVNRFTYNLEVAFPLSFIWEGKVDLNPEVSVEILFGETDNFEVSLDRLREINNFVRNDVIPRFTGFFP